MARKTHISAKGPPRGCWLAVALALTVALPASAVAQTRVSPENLAAIKQNHLQSYEPTLAAPTPAPAQYYGQAILAQGGSAAGGSTRATVDLYKGLQDTGNGFWSFGEGIYWVLDDGVMGPGAVAVGGGHVTEYEFAFGLHADFPGDTIQPYIIVSFYHAPFDPVGDATDPVVEPPTPVSSVAWLFNPITLSAAGNWSVRSGLIDLTALGFDFDLDETFYVELLTAEWDAGPPPGGLLDPDVHGTFTGYNGAPSLSYGINVNAFWSDTFGNFNGVYDHPAEFYSGTATYPHRSGFTLRGTECAANTLSLGIDAPADVCVRPGEPVTVTLAQSCLPGFVRGYQAFLAFDPARLAFSSGSYLTPLPYGLPVIVPITAVGPEINLAAGINDPSGQQPTSTSADLATLHFTAGSTPGLTNVAFRTHEPPTRFSDQTGQPVVPTLMDSPTICIDGAPPTIACPPPASVQCVAEVPVAATNYDEFVAQGGSAGDAGCCGTAVTITHQGDAANGGAGCPTDPLIITRTYRATDAAGNWAECTQTITVIDDTAPVIDCPDDATVSCDLVGRLMGWADGGILVMYNNLGPENPANQAWFRAQFSKTNANGAVFNFVPGPTGYGPTHPFQVHVDQFGLDFTLPAPTYVAPWNPPLVWFDAQDNVDGSCANATSAGDHAWAISGYAPSSTSPTGCVVNSLFRSNGIAAGSVVVTAWNVTQSGTVFTADVAGSLFSDGLIHWYTPAYGSSPMSNFGLTGTFYFAGRLTYDSFNDPGNDGDFYEGSIALWANLPDQTWGVATATDNCDPPPVVTYSDDFVQSGGCAYTGQIIRTWTATDACGNSSSCTQTITVQDTTAPSFVGLPGNRTQSADAGLCTAVLVPPIVAPTGSDNCDPSPVVTFMRSDGMPNLADPYPAGVTNITWSVVDCSGNSTTHVQTVTIYAYNDLLVIVELSPVMAAGPLTRCITFELWECSSGTTPDALVNEVLTFTNGSTGWVTVPVPCGNYTCITARDKLHTLRSTTALVDAGTTYSANFTGARADETPPGTGHRLIGGNLNDDRWIDILDFGVFSAQWGSYPNANTTCSAPAPHADITGDGFVFSGDFTFISNNFLKGHEANCCGQPGLRDGEKGNGPLTRISLAELRQRGLRHLAAGDLNGDGWLDEADIAAFMTGARPMPNRTATPEAIDAPSLPVPDQPTSAGVE